MDSIAISSPSAFLSPPIPQNTQKASIRRISSMPPQSLTKPTGVIKSKQSKSRNGCVTCKAKRLKCDETKPSCEQCHKRGVTCGGYKKDFKWRTFEEATFANKVTPPRPKKNPPKPPSESPTSSPSQPDVDHDITQDPFGIMPPPVLPGFIDPLAVFYPQERRFETSLDSLFDDPTHASPSGQSPRLIDLLLPGSELNARPHDFGQVQLESFEFEPGMDDVEEIVRQPEPWVSLPNSPASTLSETSRDDRFNRLFRQPEVQAGSPEMLMLRFDKQTCGILSVKDGPTENPWRTLVWPLARDSPALYHAIASMTAFHTSREKPALRVDGMEHMRRSIRSLASGIEKMRTDTALATTLVLAFSESWDQHISTGIEHLRGARILVNQALERHNRRALGGDELARLKFLCNTWVYMDVIARLTSIDDEELIDFDAVLTPLYGPYGNRSTEVDPLMGCAATLFPLIGKAANLCRKVRAVDTNSIAIISQAMELKEQIEQWQPGSSFEEPEDPSSDIQHALQTAESYRYATLLYLHQAVPEIPSMTSAQLAKKVLIFLATVPLSSRLVIIQIYPLLAAGCEAASSEDRQWVENRWLSMSQRMWIGNIDKCWVVTQEVWQRRDDAQAAKASTWPSLIHPESKRKFKEDPMDDFIFSDMLNGARRSRRSSASTSVQSSRKRSTDIITEELDPDMTVRGRLHWVGVMHDWGWEILLG